MNKESYLKGYMNKEAISAQPFVDAGRSVLKSKVGKGISDILRKYWTVLSGKRIDPLSRQLKAQENIAKITMPINPQDSIVKSYFNLKDALRKEKLKTGITATATSLPVLAGSSLLADKSLKTIFNKGKYKKLLEEGLDPADLKKE